MEKNNNNNNEKYKNEEGKLFLQKYCNVLISLINCKSYTILYAQSPKESPYNKITKWKNKIIIIVLV